MGGIVYEIEKTRWDHMRKTYEEPTKITMSRRAYDALLQQQPGAVLLKAEQQADGLIVPTEERVCGMEITVMDDTGSGFIVVGGTARKI